MLLKELKMIKESDAKITSESNLKAVLSLAHGSSLIKCNSETRNQWDFIVKENGRELYYCSLNEPDGDLEAFVVADKNGSICYYDSTNSVIVIDNRISRDKAYSSQKDAIEEAIDEYRIDGASSNRPPEQGAIFGYLTALGSD